MTYELCQHHTAQNVVVIIIPLRLQTKNELNAKIDLLSNKIYTESEDRERTSKIRMGKMRICVFRDFFLAIIGNGSFEGKITNLGHWVALI